MDLEWMDNISRQVVVGDRIEMVNMPDDPHPIEPGTKGVVTSLDVNSGTIGVKWDNGRTLNLIKDVDSFKILEESKKTDVIKGGKSDKLTPSDIAKKHNVTLKDIQKEIEIGMEVEMEHTDNPMVAREITLDHLTEFPDYYSNEKFGLVALEKKLKNVEQDIEETTSAGGMGASYQYSTKLESKIIKFKELIETTTTSNDKTDGTTPFDSDTFVDVDGDGWDYDEKSFWKGGKVVDPLAKRKDIDWKDGGLSLTKETLIKKVTLIEDTDKQTFNTDYKKVIKTILSSETLDQLKTAKTYTQQFINKHKELTDEQTLNKLQLTINKRKKELRADDKTVDETTTSSSVWGGDGPPVTPTFAAKKGEHIPSRKPIWKGGQIVQKIKNSGVLTELNKVRYHEDGKYVSLKKSCTDYNNKIGCSQGAIDNPVILSNKPNE